MTVILVQTNALANSGCVDDALCSGNSNNADTESNQAEEGVSPGTVPRVGIVDASASDLNIVWMECIMPAGYDGASGNWTVRIEITTGSHQLSIDEIHICRVNSSCVNQETLASSVAIARLIATAQVETFTVNQGSNATFAVGDKAVVIFAFDNAQSMTNNFVYEPTQNIDAPGSVPPFPDQFHPDYPDQIPEVMAAVPYGDMPTDSS